MCFLFVRKQTKENKKKKSENKTHNQIERKDNQTEKEKCGRALGGT